jgi:hypothetical protein
MSENIESGIRHTHTHIWGRQQVAARKKKHREGERNRETHAAGKTSRSGTREGG